MTDLEKHLYDVGLLFKSGNTAQFKVALTLDQANNLIKSVRGRGQMVQVGDPFAEGVVFDPNELDYFQMSRVPAGSTS